MTKPTDMEIIRKIKEIREKPPKPIEPPPVSQIEPRHRMKCRTCGEFFHMGELDQVIEHEHRAEPRTEGEPEFYWYEWSDTPVPFKFPASELGKTVKLSDYGIMVEDHMPDEVFLSEYRVRPVDRFPAAPEDSAEKWIHHLYTTYIGARKNLGSSMFKRAEALLGHPIIVPDSVLRLESAPEDRSAEDRRVHDEDTLHSVEVFLAMNCECGYSDSNTIHTTECQHNRMAQRLATIRSHHDGKCGYFSPSVEALRELLASCVYLIHHDSHDLNDSRPCRTCRRLRKAMIAAAVALGHAPCWCVDKTRNERREEWRTPAHFPGCDAAQNDD